MHIEVRFPNGRRMWPAHPERGTRRNAAAPFYELIPVEDGFRHCQPEDAA